MCARARVASAASAASAAANSADRAYSTAFHSNFLTLGACAYSLYVCIGARGWLAAAAVAATPIACVCALARVECFVEWYVCTRSTTQQRCGAPAARSLVVFFFFFKEYYCTNCTHLFSHTQTNNNCARICCGYFC